MKEYDILEQLLLDINAAIDDPIDVRTEGGDQPANPPEVIVSWDPTRLPDYAGHTSYAGPKTNESGVAIAKEYHGYFLMDADLMVRHEDEFERDKILSQLHDWFLPYEDDASVFSEDTSSWSVGIAGPRDNSFVEPDWYEAGVPISFVYLKRTDVDDPDRLPATVSSIDIFVNDRTLTIGPDEIYTVDETSTRYFRDIEIEGELIVDGIVYTQGYTLIGDGTITINGEVNEVSQPYDEIDDIETN